MKSLQVSVWTGQQIKEKYQNGSPLKTTHQNHQIFDVHVWEINVHMYTKYEVSMCNPVAGEVCTDDDDADTNANNDRQSMIV